MARRKAEEKAWEEAERKKRMMKYLQ